MQSHIFFSILPSRPVEKPSRDQRNFLKSRGGLPLVAGWGSTYRPRSYRPPAFIPPAVSDTLLPLGVFDFHTSPPVHLDARL